ncbi:MAG: DNA mismatch repair protein MutS [Candidatus Omnitrophica bacterium]|nr:DNA mismatch repair protein MutS [Candidatus Omnitrophota bacterium]
MNPDSRELTPMMHQYLQLKNTHQDSILFFRLGDFYEMFFDDAKIASPILGLTLTARGSGDNRVPMCGIPYHAAENYINRLITAGHKVAICEQVSDPKASKGIVKRDIVRIITPGTLIGQNMLEGKLNNFLASIFQHSEQEYGLAVADLSTGEFKVTQLNQQHRLLGELIRLNPTEIIISAGLKAEKGLIEKINLCIQPMLSDVEAWAFDYAASYDKLINHFKVKNLQGFGCEDMPQAVRAAGALLHYLEQTQKTEIKHINKITPYSLNKIMVLDGVAQRNLELTRTMRGAKKGSLLEELNYTNVPMGSRLLTSWIQQPLLDIIQINQRLDAVEELKNDQALRNSLQSELKEIGDIERLLSRISLGFANGRDLFSLNNSLKIIPKLKTLLDKVNSSLLIDLQAALYEHSDLVDLLEQSIRSDAPVSTKEGRMIKPGFNQELDELIAITRGGKDWLAALQQKEIQRTGISSLKIKYNRVFGYYIEVTNANLSMVPDDYTRKQTLVNAERFITPELKEQEEKILTAQDKMLDLELQIFGKICGQIIDQLSMIQKSAGYIAMIDVLNSLATAAANNNYTRPKLSDDSKIDIKNGRHPVLENLLSRNKFIPNDTILDTQDNQVLIITGPNMAGKSTYIRQVALIILMAQIGSFVPADQAEIGIVDRIFTRIGAADDISAGMSTFMMEMSETANILNNTTARSLIILDEIGRGTSTFDGLSIAWATAEYLHENQASKAKTLFATHYHELAEMEMMFSGIKNYNVAVREWNDEVIFLYKLIQGQADHSYGIHVARLAGLPKQVIARAREILANLEINSISSNGIPSLVQSDINKKTKQEVQPELFSQKENVLIAKIRTIDINQLSPIEALKLLNQWKQEVEKRK